LCIWKENKNKHTKYIVISVFISHNGNCEFLSAKGLIFSLLLYSDIDLLQKSIWKNKDSNID